jgi:hypothetical protein
MAAREWRLSHLAGTVQCQRPGSIHCPSCRSLLQQLRIVDRWLECVAPADGPLRRCRPCVWLQVGVLWERLLHRDDGMRWCYAARLSPAALAVADLTQPTCPPQESCQVLLLLTLLLTIVLESASTAAEHPDDDQTLLAVSAVASLSDWQELTADWFHTLMRALCQRLASTILSATDCLPLQQQWGEAAADDDGHQDRAWASVFVLDDVPAPTGAAMGGAV